MAHTYFLPCSLFEVSAGPVDDQKSVWARHRDGVELIESPTGKSAEVEIFLAGLDRIN
ncbi:MAG: hypothetical protein QOH41_1080 [Blastocatellia bacterium]|jgi:hypothetical protein|nr:hypothetical protein [Blastocatellia bacterium]